MTDNLPSVVRSAVEPQSHYSGYREVLRFDFWYSCAYCSVAETEAWGFGFQIDHFEPQSNNSTDAHTYSNLMWSCEPCNSKKSNWWPDESMRARGIRYLRPDMDVFAEHLELAGYRLKALSKAGEYTIEMLYLNRAALQHIRKARSELARSSAAIAHGLQALLSRKLEGMKPEFRTRFAKARELAMRQQSGLREQTLEAAVVRILNNSPLIDPDPEKKAQASRRREYLKSVHAFAAESGTVV